MGRWFWKVTRYARAAKFWLLLALAALAWLGIDEARAHNVSDKCPQIGQQPFAVCNIQQASAYVQSVAEGQAHCDERWPPVGTTTFDLSSSTITHTTSTNPKRFTISYACRYYQNNNMMSGSGQHSFVYAVGCPAGTEWDSTLNRCDCANGYTFRPDGTCKSCESMNSEPGFGNAEVVRPFKERCLGGCQFRAKPNASTCMLIGGAGAGTQHCSGEWEFTGAACSVGGGDPPMLESPVPGEPGTQKPKQECTPAGAGQTVCIKENGDHCYSASTGRQICWKPGQAGEQGDGPVAQVRKPGTETPLPSSMQTNAGDALTSEGEPMTVTTVVNGQLTVTTTTQNYRTEHGTDAKPDNSGQPSDGSEEEQQDGSASGGTDCDTRPVVSDPALEMVATQAWATRCAVEAGNAAAVSGDVSDCQSPFSVEGTNANAVKLRAMRAQICGDEDRADAERQAAGEMESLADALEPGEGESVFADGDGGESLSTTRFGAGGGSCPATGLFVIPGVGEVETTGLCNALAALRMLFLAIATIGALAIVGRS